MLFKYTFILICIVLQHRLNTIIDYDRVIVLDMGRVLEFNTPAMLLTNRNSAFSALVDETGPENSALLRMLATAAANNKRGSGLL